MAENTTLFPSPNPPLPTITTSIENLQQAHDLALTRAVGAVASRDVLEGVLRKQLAALGGYVEMTANANGATIVQATATIKASGFGAKAKGKRVKAVLEARPGAHSGAVVLIAKAVRKGKVFYDWRYSLDGGKSWIAAPSTNDADTILENLPVGTTAMFQHRVTRKNVAGDWGPIVSLVVS